MEKVISILHKKYKDKLMKKVIYKDKLSKMQGFLREFKIPCAPKDEFSFFQCEIIYESIYNKKRMEDSYLDSYIEMHDFWNDLDYKERKHQVNVDMHRKCADLKHFPYEQEEIYIPVFDKRMNNIYGQEIVLLDLKQYHRFLKEFIDIMQENRYGILPYQYGFTSSVYICGDDHAFCIYQPEMNRMYFIERFKCVQTISLDPQRKDQASLKVMEELAYLYYQNDVQAFVETLLLHHLVDERVEKKLRKYCEKRKR